MHKKIINMVLLILMVSYTTVMANEKPHTLSIDTNKVQAKQKNDLPDPYFVLNSPIKGTMSTCFGVASTGYQQFTFSGYNLTREIGIFAPYQFELSLNSTSGYSIANHLYDYDDGDGIAYINIVLPPPVNGKLENITIYIRVTDKFSYGEVINNHTNGDIWIHTGGTAGFIPAQLVVKNIDATILPYPQVSTTGMSQVACNGTTITPGPFKGTGTLYSWTNDSPSIGLPANGTGNLPSFIAQNTGTKAINAVIKVTPSAQCEGQPAAIVFTINPTLKPVLKIDVNKNPLCTGDKAEFTLTPTNTGSAPTYTWLVNGNPTGVNGLTYTSSTLKNGDKVSCNISSPVDCFTSENSNTITAIVNPAPDVHFAKSIYNISLGQSIKLDPVINGVVTGYTWSPALGLSNTTIERPVASPLTTTTYQLQLANNSNCLAIGNVTVNVHNDYVENSDGYLSINIPNTFTPNGDGVNDTWSIPQLVGFPRCSMRVYNRYGSIVYQSTGYSKAWDGTINGKQLPVGPFYYVLDLNTGDPVIGGYVYILR